MTVINVDQNSYVPPLMTPRAKYNVGNVIFALEMHIEYEIIELRFYFITDS